MGFAKAMCNNGAGSHRRGKDWTRPTTYYTTPVEDDTPKEEYVVRILYKCVDLPEFEGDKKYGFLWYRIDKAVVMTAEEYREYGKSENFDTEFFCGKWTQLPQSEEFRIYDITDNYMKIKEVMSKYICPDNPESIYIYLNSVINIKDYRKKIF